MKKLLQIIGISAVVIFAAWLTYMYFKAPDTLFGYARVITNPVANSSLSSAVIRAEFQALEDEITLLGSAYPFPSSATSTLINFSGGIKIATLTGLIAGNSGTLYQIATSSAVNMAITGSAGSVSNAITFNNSGAGAVSGQTFTGANTLTVSYNTIGAAPWPFTLATNFGKSLVASTTNGNPIWFQNGLVASTTAIFDNATTTNATTTTGYISNTFSIGSTSPWALLSINPTTGSLSQAFAIGSSTQTLFGINSFGQIQSVATSSATSTAITLNWGNSPNQVEYRIGTAAVTITFINATTSQYFGSRKVVWVCNPGSTAGALTWRGVNWIGTTPVQTTTADQCDVVSCDVTQATSTNAYKVACTQGSGLQ